MLSKESVSNCSSLSRYQRSLFLSRSLSHSRVRTIKDYTSDQKVHDQPTTVCGTNVHIERPCTRESSMTRVSGRICAGRCDASCRILESDRSCRIRVNASRRWPSEKPRQCFRSPLTGKSKRGREGGKTMPAMSQYSRRCFGNERRSWKRRKEVCRFIGWNECLDTTR